MRPTALLASAAFVCLTAAASPALAQHDVRAFLSESGVEFIENNAASFVPSVLHPQPVTKAVGCMDFIQRDTTVNLHLDKLDIEMPANDRIRVSLDVTIDAQGELYVDDLYACLGEVTCQDTLNLRSASALVDLDVAIIDGKPKVTMRDVQVEVDPDNFEFALNECGVTGSVLTSTIGFAEGWILSYAEDKLVSIAEEKLPTMLESVLAGLSMDGAYVKASVQDIYFPNNGLSVTASGGLKEKYEAAECIREFDDGGPGPEQGARVPDIMGAGASDLNVAVNIGLINEGLYSVWHRGLMCLSDRHLAELGVEVDLQQIATVLPGFPPGTTLGMDFRFTKRPRVKSSASEDAELTVVIEGFELDFHGDTPDGHRNTLHAELDVEASARLALDPGSNAIHVQLLGAQITRMEMQDERAATGEGYDVARMKQLVHDAILPKVLEQLGTIPVTGSAFAIPKFALMLRSMSTNKAYLSAGIDLFRVPDVDDNAPDTKIVSAPSSVSNPHDAIVSIGGSDAELPEELLQYLVSVDGVERPLSFVKEAKIGEIGVTKSYTVQVAAVDLAGNVDPSPASTTVTVDGIVPFVIVNGARTRSADAGPVEIDWSMHDDSSAPEALKVRVDIYDLEDPSDALSARLIDSQELPAGATSTSIELAKVGGVYRVEVHAIDEAGNDSQSSLLLSIASTGGCSVGGQGQGQAASLVLLAMAMLIGRRRSRKQ